MSERSPAAGTPAGPPEEDPRIEGEKHPVAKMLAIGIAASVVGIAITLLIDWFPIGAATSAGKIDTLYDVLLICSVPVFVLVMSVAIYSVVRFRAMPGDMRDGAPIHGNTRLEVIWVTIPFLMVTALSIYGWIVLDDLEAKQPDELVVNVTGQQFTWTFAYPGEDVRSTELVLPKDRPVDFRVKTADVIHSFWVPEFRLKSDAVPGLTTKIRLTPDRIGRYQVVCAELCGIGHATMRQNVRVVEPAEFDRWLERQKQAAAGGAAGGATGGAEAGGGGSAAVDPKALFTANCASCHTLEPAGATATVGPDLDQLSNADEAYVRQSIVEPGAVVVEGFQDGIMPTDFKAKLSDEEIDALVGYLLEAQ
ncbi:MAG: cytochrome c oxidase subunit [Thermoleophilaceae bacterium]|jgi:cytochrome c oxidase subunit 2|nr:cytochrome c oxidase subunit [Thermoleophilaceae bacterium]